MIICRIYCNGIWGNMKKSILVIDNDPSILTIFEYLISDRYVINTALSGSDALSFMEKNPNIDLLFLDIKMPNFSGLDVLQLIQKLDNPPYTIMMTGYSMDDMIKKSFELGASSILYKPFDATEVNSIIAQYEKECSAQKILT